MFEERWYQTECVNAFFSYFHEKSGNPIFCLPTGAGKSFVQADIVKRIYEQFPGQRIIAGTHVKELIEQNYNTLLRHWPLAPAGIMSAGLKRREFGYPLTFAGVQTLRKVIAAFGHIDLLFVDECHLISDKDETMWIFIINELKKVNPKLKVIGFTATWWRAKTGCLTNGPIFTDIAYNVCDIPGFKRLFTEGYLVPPRAKVCANIIDASNVSIVAGEYSKSQLNAITAHAEITWKALNEALSQGHDRHCRLVFCTGIEHAMLSADMLKTLGLRAAAIHSQMGHEQRDAIMRAYRAGELDTLCNNGICTTGLDHPPIDHIIMLRPTMSVGLWVQMLGRGMRPFTINARLVNGVWTADFQKEDCLVSDHAGNAQRLGTIDDPYIPAKAGKRKGDAPVRICPACGCYNHASAASCMFCGEVFEKKIGFKEKAYEDKLVASDMPIIENFDVEQVHYYRHESKNPATLGKPSLKCVYVCQGGLHTFAEFLQIESPGYAGFYARKIWRERFPDHTFVPSTVTEALTFVDKLRPPKRISVHVNKKFPEVKSYEY